MASSIHLLTYMKYVSVSFLLLLYIFKRMHAWYNT